jgi:hypothetical protein
MKSPGDVGAPGAGGQNMTVEVIRARTKAGKNTSTNTFDKAAINWARDVRLPNDATLKTLSPRACRRGTVKSVLLAVAFRVSGDDHSTFTGLDRLARDTGFDERTVRLALTLLEQLGLLQRAPCATRRTDNIYLHVGAKCSGTLPGQLSGHAAHSVPGTLPGHCPGINASKELGASTEAVVRANLRRALLAALTQSALRAVAA